jgi:hypothetical protein
MDTNIILRKFFNWKNLVAIVIALGLVWLSPVYAGYVGPLLVLIFFIPILYFVFKWQFISAVLYVLLSPVAVFFYLGAVDYSRGTAVIIFKGLPRNSGMNLDPELRCPKSNAGCVIQEYEWMEIPPYNTAVLGLHHLFGPMRGAYTGPYPTKEETFMALRTADTINLNELIMDKGVIGSQEIKLESGVGRKLLTRLSIQYAVEAKDSNEIKNFINNIGPVKGTVWKEKCLILRIPGDFDYFEKHESKSARIALIDCERGRPFAYYYEGEDIHEPFPPVLWNTKF